MSPEQKFILSAERVVAFNARFQPINRPETALNIYKDELEKLWTDCQKKYDLALNQAVSTESSTIVTRSKEEGRAPMDCEAITNKYLNTLDVYASLCGTISDLLKAFQPPPLPTSAEPPAFFNSSSGQGFKVPPCDIDNFHGDYLSWPTFRDLFTAIYIENSRLSNAEKLYHLRQKTKGDANLLVAKVPLTNDGFQLAWQHLLDTYENKRVLTNTQLEILFKLQPVRVENSESLKTLQRGICSVLEALQLYDIDISSWDPILVFHCCQRLPETTLTLWEQTISDKKSLPSWDSLNSFLTARRLTLESVAGIRSATASPIIRKNPSGAANQHRAHHANLQKATSAHTCPLCKTSHKLRGCDKFKAMTAVKKYEFLKAQNWCINCLDSSHTVFDCPSQFNCTICSRRHHTWLHFKTPIQHTNPGPVPTKYMSAATAATSSNDVLRTSVETLTTSNVAQSFHQVQHMNIKSSSNDSPNILLGTAMVLISHLGLTYPVRALIDSASEVSFLSNNVRKRLNLTTWPANAIVSGVNEHVAASSSRRCSVTLKSLYDEQFQIECQALVLPRITGNLPSFSLEAIDSHTISNLQLADGEFYKSSPIDLLIGGDLYASVVLSGVQHNILGSLIAQETVFGWILTGPCPKKVSSYATTIITRPETPLDTQLQRFWEIEEVPHKKHLSTSDTYCETLFQDTTWRQSDGRFVVSLPFKQEYTTASPLGVSRPKVLKQFLRNEANLQKRPEFKSTYDSVLTEYLDLNHMDQVQSPGRDESHLYFYLPHHPVIKPDSTTTALRVVFNASSNTSNGLSLKDVLHTGPVLQTDLTYLLLKWRLYRYVFNSDITKMYRQILVEPNQRRFQRILFRSDIKSPIQDFELKTVTFGVNCAPFLAIRTLHQLAQDVFHTHPLAAKILRQNMYVDDVLAGYHNISTARLARDQLIDAMRTAGFTLRKWTSNNRQILEGLPRTHLLDESFLEFEEASSSKALGVRWNAIRDDFYFSIEPFVRNDTYTKREVLSFIAKLFDPAGWLGPVIVAAKMIMQHIWLDKTDWDEALTASTMIRWLEFLKEFPSVGKVRIPRWIGYDRDQHVHIHGFSDASEKAFAGAIYIRCEQFGAVFTQLFMAKTKVAPVKTVSLPRLELCGALLLSQMLTSLLSELKFPNKEIVCWTDSTIVLSWIQKAPCAWTTFVANRVAKIQDSVGIQCWRHVDSKDNPADIASRGIMASELVDHPLWWHGPPWLSRGPEHWPPPLTSISDTVVEAKTAKVHTTTVEKAPEDLLDRFSDFPRALRVVAYMIRFVQRAKKLEVPSDLPITTLEIRDTQMRLIKICQQKYFGTDYTQLSKQSPLPTKSPLLTLNPILDSKGIMRVNGRLIYSQSLTMAEKFPILLPYHARFSRLLVHFLHLVSLHGGNQLVLRLLRQEYWIPKAANLIKTIINHCKPCVIYKHKQASQIMAALPPERSSISRAFDVTGVDFAGPFEIKNFTGRACLITKGYVCIFVCFSTRAIHLEVTSALTTDSFLAAFARFFSRRGCPRKIYSDNGTTFVGASKALRRDFADTVREVEKQISNRYILQNITWSFIPAGAPHMGGLWEAGVKSFKMHLRKAVNNFRFTFEEFSTLLCRIEACLNSRPLCATSKNCPDISALTPGHFLIGAPIMAPADPLISDSPISMVNRWRRLNVISQNISLRWKEEYLKELHKRFKWKNPTKELVENDLVVVRHENLPPTEWRLGRVIKLFPGPDQRSRVAEIRTQRGIITRPIVKLVSLPNDNAL